MAATPHAVPRKSTAQSAAMAGDRTEAADRSEALVAGERTSASGAEPRLRRGWVTPPVASRAPAQLSARQLWSRLRRR